MYLSPFMDRNLFSPDRELEKTEKLKREFSQSLE